MHHSPDIGRALEHILADGTIANLAPDRPVTEMLEMGEASIAAHDFLGEDAVRLGTDHLVVVGVGACCSNQWRAIGRVVGREMCCAKRRDGRPVAAAKTRASMKAVSMARGRSEGAARTASSRSRPPNRHSGGSAGSSRRLRDDDWERIIPGLERSLDAFCTGVILLAVLYFLPILFLRY